MCSFINSTDININACSVPGTVMVADRSAVRRPVVLSVLVVYYCVMNYLKLSGLKHLLSHSFWGSGTQEQLRWSVLALKVLHQGAAGLSTGLLSHLKVQLGPMICQWRFLSFTEDRFIPSTLRPH